MDAPTPITHHAHDAGLGTPLDLINTLELTDGQPDDHLATVGAAVDFLVGHGLAHEEDLRSQASREGDAWLARIRVTRAALREVWDAQVEGRTPDPRALRTLNAILDRGPRLELRATLAGVEVAHRHRTDDPTGEALARAASARRGDLGGRERRFRICANAAAAGSSRTRRARGTAAGATCRPAATAPRCGASARGAAPRTGRPRRPDRPR